MSALRFDWYHFELDLTSGSTAVVYGHSYYNTTKGALTSLHIGNAPLVLSNTNNGIPTDKMNEIITLVEAMPAMKVLCAVPFRDKTITELDVSGQSLGVEGAIVIRRYLENNGSLESITFGDKQAVTMKTIMTEADFSSKQLGASGAIIVAAFLSKCQ